MKKTMTITAAHHCSNIRRSDLFQFALVEVLGLGRGIHKVSIRDLANALGATTGRVRYHVKKLIARGVIVAEKVDGRFVVSLPPFENALAA
jgi:AcrR family transcriptional regulator